MITSCFLFVSCGSKIKFCPTIMFNASLVDNAFIHRFIIHQTINTFLTITLFSMLALLLGLLKYFFSYVIMLCCISLKVSSAAVNNLNIVLIQDFVE